jgi:stage II sporulation protein D
VLATRSEILTFEGQPIIAYYTATCGGHTEDGHEIFPEELARPYLRGVPCRAEADALAAQRATLAGRALAAAIDESGRDVTRDVALLEVAGIVDPAPLPADWPALAIGAATLREWNARLASLAGLAPPAGAAGSVETLGRAAATILADLGWGERSRVLLSGADLPALLRDGEAEALPEDERRALAYLAFAEAIAPFPDGRYHVDRRPTAASLVPILARIGERYDAFGLAQGVVSGVHDRTVRLIRGKGEVRHELGGKAYLFSRSGGRSVPVAELELWPGDRVTFRTDAQGRIDFLEVAPPVKGVSDDRVASVYSWEERKTRHDLEESINRRIAIGRLENLEVVRRGVSGRVVELRLVGSRATTTARGFDVRRLLDLRESLMVIEVQRDAAGKLDAVVFAGKGWGHGVGLCQVGAYGMAVRGSTYKEILAHFYRESELQSLERRAP